MAMRLNAYYYSFEPTGVEAIDRILSAIACAGKAFHLTEDWNDQVYDLDENGQKIPNPYEPFLRGWTVVEWIQNAANDAAAEAHPATAVRRFHEAFGVSLDAGSWWSPPRRLLRQRLITEEFREWHAAEVADDPAATLDALVDLTYVIIGAALEYGRDFAGAFAAVHAANMAKLGPDGKPILRDDGKVLKPEGWKPADLTPFLGREPK